jgi:hypothetical protein
MKILLALFFSFTSFLFSAELKHITLGNQNFSITTETYDIYDSKGEVMRLYKEERNNDLTFILSLRLKDRTGSCADKRMQDGSYEINGTGIMLYSFWDRKGRAYNSPYGARIQHYEILPNHTVVLRSSKVYIETERRNYDEESAIKYLFTAPVNDVQKEALQVYVKDIETDYKGTFVYAEEAKRLLAEVQEALTRKIKSKWNKR